MAFQNPGGCFPKLACEFSLEPVAFALRPGGSGKLVAKVCRHIGISKATFYSSKKKYADLGVAELRRLKMLKDENARLKRPLAYLTLDRQILQEVVRKKL